MNFESVVAWKVSSNNSIFIVSKICGFQASFCPEMSESVSFNVFTVQVSSSTYVFSHAHYLATNRNLLCYVQVGLWCRNNTPTTTTNSTTTKLYRVCATWLLLRRVYKFTTTFFDESATWFRLYCWSVYGPSVYCRQIDILRSGVITHRWESG